MFGGTGLATAAGRPIGVSPKTDVVARAPLAVSVTFDQSLRSGGATLQVIGTDGEDGRGPVTTANRTLRRKLRLGAPAGPYRVVWKVVAADGRRMSGSFSFTAARSNQVPAPAAVGPGPAPTLPRPAPPIPEPAPPVPEPAPPIPEPAPPIPKPAPPVPKSVPPFTHPAESPAAAENLPVAGPQPVAASLPSPGQPVSPGFAAVPIIVGALLVFAAGVVSLLNKRRLPA